MRKQNMRYQYILYLLIPVLFLLLAAGATYARYQNDLLTTSFWLTPAVPDTVQLHGAVSGGDVEGVPEGTWPAAPAVWGYDSRGAELHFSVSNGTSAQDYSSRDQAITVELIALLTIEDPENLTVKLRVEDVQSIAGAEDSESEEAGDTSAGEAADAEAGEPTEYQGVAQAIVEGSKYDAVYGKGWVYRFYEENGEEVQLTLEGGSLQYRNCTLTVIGAVESSLLSLELSGQYTDTE